MTFILVIHLFILTPSFSHAFQNSDDHQLVIKKQEFTLRLFSGDSLEKTYTVAVGKAPGDKQRRGDNRTPEGEFVISQIQDSRRWVHDFGDGNGPIAGAYGPWFLRLKVAGGKKKNWTGIGIHGTHDPASLGTRASEGCVRMKNEEIKELQRLVRVGTRVSILP